MKNIDFEFTSIFAAKLTAFVEEKQSLGYDYRAAAKKLRGFDNTMQACGVTSDMLTESTVLLWTSPKSGETAKNHIIRISAMRTFAVYLTGRGEEAYICPYPHQKDIQVYQPYIFTKDELSRIFKAADSLKYDLRSPRLHLTTPVIIKTLYGTGMRISEVLNLKRRDVDLGQLCIMARDTKGGKERLLPITKSLGNIYTDYCNNAKFSAGDYLFCDKNGDAITNLTFYHSFRVMLEKAGITHLGRGRGPRIHDFRHTMAVHRLNEWAIAKKDITAMLPVLAVYLGHENVRIASYYLRLTAQVYPEVTAQVEKDFGEVIPDIISKEREALGEYD